MKAKIQEIITRSSRLCVRNPGKVPLLALVVFSLAFTACFSPLDEPYEGQTTISITMPGKAMTRVVGDPGAMAYELTLSGPNGEIITEIAGPGETVKASVTPGLWDIILRAYDPATGIDEAIGRLIGHDVKAGQVNSPTIEMYFVQIPPIANYLIAVGGTLSNPASLRLDVELNTSNWNDLLDALGLAGVYVKLDLSACEPNRDRLITPLTDNNGGLYNDGTFYPNPFSHAGKDCVVSITLPDDADRIIQVGSGSLFADFSTLSKVDIGKGITRIEGKAFADFKLTELVLNDKLEFIGDSVFYNSQLSSFSIPNSVTHIGDEAFGANLLTSVTIPDRVTHIGDGAFGANLLTSVTIPDRVTYLSGFNNNQLTSLSIPNSVTRIGEMAFYENQLSSVAIPASVTHIGGYAFSENQLSSLNIPNSVNTIGYAAFQLNPLTSVSIGANVTLEKESWSGPVFDGDLDQVYNDGGRQAGTYTRTSDTSSDWARVP